MKRIKICEIELIPKSVRKCDKVADSEIMFDDEKRFFLCNECENDLSLTYDLEEKELDWQIINHPLIWKQIKLW